MKDIKKIITIFGIIILIAGLIFIGSKYYLNKESFSVNTIFLKSNILIGGEALSSIKITNNEEMEQNFEVYFDDFNEFASIKDKKFTLNPGQSKNIEINFRDINNKVEIYAGKLIVETEILIKEIPIIFGVEEEESAFVIIQKTIPKYEDVYPGGKIGVEIKIFNLEDDISHKIKAKYSIRNLNNELILSEEESLVVKENLGISKTIDISKTIPRGYYIFITTIDYNGAESMAGYLFDVSLEKQEIDQNFNSFIIVILLFFIGILILFFYFIKAGDDLLKSLQKQQNKELERNLKLIKASRIELEKLKDVSERNKKIKQLDQTKKVIVKKVKHKQEIQRKEMTRLKKQGKKDQMKLRLDEWRKQGFSMFETEKQLKRISKQDIGKQIDYMKKKGYKTEFLGKQEDI
ncbi:MAG: hypothetical protein QF567_03085 [Candidatus Pacearchaeota archaeon]|jgi:hypothetical protein|nr:hypothetical protein [Candidatus Pacearchaeota archaeon]|tara:strand:- start:472 stop:1689 length:1218 start_codon:yes stop_codon:yes gene_type:complete